MYEHIVILTNLFMVYLPNFLDYNYKIASHTELFSTV